MKKYICILLLLLCSCSKNTSFIGKHYIRYTDYGIESICFLENGQFSYYDDAGEPVDDSDSGDAAAVLRRRVRSGGV